MNRNPIRGGKRNRSPGQWGTPFRTEVNTLSGSGRRPRHRSVLHFGRIIALRWFSRSVGSTMMPKIEIQLPEPNGTLARALGEQLHHLMARVRHRAYELGQQRQGTQDADLEDWLRAE